MIPVVVNYDTHDKESIESYLARWPSKFANIPNNVIEQWIHRHNPQFIEEWVGLSPEKWKFELVEMSNEEIYSIQHLDGELKHWDYVGDKILFSDDRYQWLAIYIRENGTFPEPIICAVNAGHIHHPRGRKDEMMMEPYQLIEGHRRIGLIRAMIRKSVATLKSHHKVWLLDFSA
jgi:hypothetical protein